MHIDENLFFRQAALKICGSLDIATALGDLLDYLRSYIPAERLSLCRFEPDLSLIHALVVVDAQGRCRSVPAIATPARLRPMLARHIDDWRQVRIVNEPELDPIAKLSMPYMTISDPSVMGMVLVVDGITLGAFGVAASGKQVFGPEHARLLELLREPIGIALSNALRYDEVLRLKDMLKLENRELSRELQHSVGDEIVGADFGLAGVLEMVRQVAPLASPVMLLGETGVGKEVIANALHRLSPRSEASFIKVNCGAIPDSLLDSELFGHEKGAFTGALSQKRGRFERADRGTIFLDEVGELPPKAQVRLLRVLQHQEIERVGGSRTIKVDVRVICATNRDLEAMVRAGSFRQDLWYRLNIFPISIPPLRERRNGWPAKPSWPCSNPAPARAAQRHSGPDPSPDRTQVPRTRHPRTPAGRQPGPRTASELRLAWQRARAEQPDRTRTDPAPGQVQPGRLVCRTRPAGRWRPEAKPSRRRAAGQPRRGHGRPHPPGARTQPGPHPRPPGRRSPAGHQSQHPAQPHAQARHRDQPGRIRLAG